MLKSSNKHPPILDLGKEGLTVRIKETTDDKAWDDFVHTHPDATVYHLSAWQDIIQRTYGHRPLYLMAVPSAAALDNDGQPQAIVGILPLIIIKSRLFGKSLVSLPFFDHAGLLVSSDHACQALLTAACRFAERLKVKTIGLRQLGISIPERLHSSCTRNWFWSTKTDKASLQLSLPETSEALMTSFKSKLRSQIKNPMKKGLEAQIGGKELLPAFYKVFCVNMRDLGSPVHSIRLMENVLAAFPEMAHIVLVHIDQKVLAGSLIVGYGKTLENPWASSLREFSRLNANMLLYWRMLEYACDRGYRTFNFGRSSKDEGTYKFKRQWGAKPKALYWYSLSRGPARNASSPDKGHYQKLIQMWQKLPLPIASALGPAIRKHINL